MVGKCKPKGPIQMGTVLVFVYVVFLWRCMELSFIEEKISTVI